VLLDRDGYIRKYKALPDCIRCLNSEVYKEYEDNDESENGNPKTKFKARNYVRCKKLKAIVAIGYGAICEYFVSK